jgi:AcrR family transcriptional regulator
MMSASAMTTPSVDAAPPRASASNKPGRPRSQEREREILRAAIDALIEDGYDAMSVEGVAARAGAGKATLYRRWSNKAELVADAIREHVSLEIPLADTGDVRADMRAFLEGMKRAFNGVDGKLLAVFTAERLRNPELAAAFEARHVSGRRAHLHRIVREAVARGDLPADTDVELLAEVGPAIMLHEFVKRDGKLQRDVVDRVMRQFFA